MLIKRLFARLTEGAFHVTSSCYGRSWAHPGGPPVRNEELKKFVKELDRGISRDEALVWCGYVFGPEYTTTGEVVGQYHCLPFLSWYFRDGGFERDRLRNHVMSHVDAWEYRG
jgi:hypothetical protein